MLKHSENMVRAEVSRAGAQGGYKHVLKIRETKRWRQQSPKCQDHLGLESCIHSAHHVHRVVRREENRISAPLDRHVLDGHFRRNMLNGPCSHPLSVRDIVRRSTGGPCRRYVCRGWWWPFLLCWRGVRRLRVRAILQHP